MSSRILEEKERRDSRLTWVALGAVLLAGAFLRLRGLGARGLWTDELVSFWAVSASSVADLVRRSSACMATPPLSFLGERLSVSILGNSEWALRLPSALSGIAAIGVVFLAGRRMFGAGAGLLAAAILAVHPFHIGFSSDARPYALATLFGALSLWAWSELMFRPRPGWLVLHVLSSVALIYTQFVFLPLILAQLAGYLLGRRAGMARALSPGRAGAALAATLALSLPLLPQILGVAGRATSLAWPAAEEYPPWIYWFFQTTPLFCAVLIGLVLSWTLGPAGSGAGRYEESPTPRSRFDALNVALAFLVPSILVGVIALGGRLPSLAKPRYGAAYLAACVLLLGYLLSRPALPAARRATAGAYLFLVVLTQVVPPLVEGRSFSVDAELEGWREAALVLEAERGPQDVVLLRSPLVETAELYTGKFPEPCSGYLAAPLSGFYRKDGSDVIVLPPSLLAPPYPRIYAERIGSRIAGRNRVWLVMAGAPDPQGYVDAVLSLAGAATGRPFGVLSVRSFGLVSVALLTTGS